MSAQPDLKTVYDALRDDKSPDQIAFEEAVIRVDAHSWLIDQDLGAYNRYYLHKCLMRNNASAMPYLIKKEAVKHALSEFVPSVESVEEALKDRFFSAALRDAIQDNSYPIHMVYFEAMQSSDYGQILFEKVCDLKP